MGYLMHYFVRRIEMTLMKTKTKKLIIQSLSLFLNRIHYLKPFLFDSVKKMFPEKTFEEIVNIYSTAGGTPLYLNKFKLFHLPFACQGRKSAE